MSWRAGSRSAQGVSGHRRDPLAGLVFAFQCDLPHAFQVALEMRISVWTLPRLAFQRVLERIPLSSLSDSISFFNAGTPIFQHLKHKQAALVRNLSSRSRSSPPLSRLSLKERTTPAIPLSMKDEGARAGTKFHFLGQPFPPLRWDLSEDEGAGVRRDSRQGGLNPGRLVSVGEDRRGVVRREVIQHLAVLRRARHPCLGIVQTRRDSRRAD